MSFAANRMGRRFFGKVMAAGLLTATFLGQAHADIAFKDAKGDVKLDAQPKKVVVFDLAVLDTMKVLGVKAAAVPQFKYPANLAEYETAAYPKVGSLFEPDYEKVAALAPDLIIVAGRSQPKYAELSKIAKTIDLTVNPADLIGSVKRNTHILGQIFGKQAQADAALSQLDQSVKALHDKAQKAGPGLIVMTVGNKISAYGPGSRFGVLYDAFGIVPADNTVKVSNHGQAASFEYLYKTNPKWLFVIDRDTAIGQAKRTPQQALDNELVHKMTAWKDGHVVFLNSQNWYLLGSAGITALSENIAQIDKAFDTKK